MYYLGVNDCRMIFFWIFFALQKIGSYTFFYRTYQLPELFQNERTQLRIKRIYYTS